MNVVFTEAFDKKRKKKEYQDALEKVLARARKSNW